MVEINNKTRTKIDLSLVRKVSEQVLSLYKKDKYELSIGFVGDVTISKLNWQYRRVKGKTDVLSFEGEDMFLGEVIIDYQQIKRQAKKYGNTPKQELIFNLVHGILHLFGHEDDTEKKRLAMIELGEKIIKKLKF